MPTEEDLLKKLKEKSISLKMELLDADDEKVEKKIKKKLKQIKKDIKELEETHNGKQSGGNVISGNISGGAIVQGASLVGDINIGNTTNKESVKKKESKKIAFICSSPKGKNPLDFGAEFKKIKKALLQSSERDSFNIEIETGVEADYFINLLSKKPYPYIVHISMHASKSQGLYFEDKNGEEYPMPEDQFTAKFKLLQENRPELVILAACNSFKYAEAISPYVKYVVGAKDFLPDNVAALYANKFYEILFEGNGVEQAHNIALDSIKNAPIPDEEKERLKTPLHEIMVLLKG